MKQIKRNAVILMVVLFVGAAAYLNWSYGQTDTAQDGAEAADVPEYTEPETEGAASDEGLYYAEAGTDDTATPEYFSTVRITRQQARDSAVETLSAVNSAEGASREVLDAALEKISQIAADSQKEAELEALIMAKGFGDCVVFVSDDGVKVTVPAPQSGLTGSEVAKITDVVTAETGRPAADLKIIEVKS
jgi:stage III sporulation protein AH